LYICPKRKLQLLESKNRQETAAKRYTLTPFKGNAD
jgi:hypothetical protein